MPRTSACGPYTCPRCYLPDVGVELCDGSDLRPLGDLSWLYSLRIHPQLSSPRNVHRSGVRVDDLLIPDGGLSAEVKRTSDRVTDLSEQPLGLGLLLLRSIL